MEDGGDDILKVLANTVKEMSMLPDEDTDRHRLESSQSNKTKLSIEHQKQLAIQMIESILQVYYDVGDGNDGDSEGITMMKELVGRLQKGGGSSADDQDTYDMLSQITESMQDEIQAILDNPSSRTFTQPSTASAATTSAGSGHSKSPASARPQDRFPKDDIDNSRTPFVMKLKTKPNAVETFQASPGSAAASSGNPYATEIRGAALAPPQWLFAVPSPIPMFKKLNEVKYEFIDKVDDFNRMVEAISREPAIAVDLENHSMRSFQGFVCLMQISTRNSDYLVDTLALRSHLQFLNLVFTNPGIVKVFHGSDYDVEWLQRDFGLFVVNLFDTGQAARVLEYPSAALAFSMQMHCGVNPNKAFQLADWRIRPLTEQMIKYAREDTRYLLYIFDKMRGELLEKARKAAQSSAGSQEMDLIVEVIRRSMQIASKTYEKPMFKANGYEDIILKGSLKLSPIQKRVMERLYEWRDRVAREADESMSYILSVPLLTKISSRVPQTMQELESCVIGESMKLSPAFKSRLPAILDIVLAAIQNDGTTSSSKAQEQPKQPKPVAAPASSAATQSSAGMGQSFVSGQANPTISIGVNNTQKVFAPVSSSGSSRSRDRFHNDSGSDITPEQLFESLGWKEVSDKQKRVGMLARKSQTPSNAGGTSSFVHAMSGGTQAPSSSSESVLFRRLRESKLDSQFASDSSPSSVAAASQSSTMSTPPQNALDKDADTSVSLKEIYAISNLNRKKNKSKKSDKKAPDAAGDSGGVQDAASAQDEQAPSSTARDPITFMKSIGWIPEGDTSTLPSRAAGTAGSSGHGRENAYSSDDGASLGNGSNASSGRRRRPSNDSFGPVSLHQRYGGKNQGVGGDGNKGKGVKKFQQPSPSPGNQQQQQQQQRPGFQYTAEHARAAGVIPSADSARGVNKQKKKFSQA